VKRQPCHVPLSPPVGEMAGRPEGESHTRDITCHPRQSSHTPHPSRDAMRPWFDLPFTFPPTSRGHVGRGAESCLANSSLKVTPLGAPFSGLCRLQITLAMAGSPDGEDPSVPEIRTDNQIRPSSIRVRYRENDIGLPGLPHRPPVRTAFRSRRSIVSQCFQVRRLARHEPKDGADAASSCVPPDFRVKTLALAPSGCRYARQR
jgi:hypothetical protein